MIILATDKLLAINEIPVAIWHQNLCQTDLLVLNYNNSKRSQPKVTLDNQMRKAMNVALSFSTIFNLQNGACAQRSAMHLVLKWHAGSRTRDTNFQCAEPKLTVVNFRTCHYCLHGYCSSRKRVISLHCVSRSVILCEAFFFEAVNA